MNSPCAFFALFGRFSGDLRPLFAGFFMRTRLAFSPLSRAFSLQKAPRRPRRCYIF
jgi:hypothetical protein